MTTPAFDPDRYDDAYPAGIEHSWWHVARNAIVAHAFKKHLPRNARVLEVGCGTGIVTHALRERGWEVTGVDLGEPRHGLLAQEHLLLRTDALQLPEVLRRSFTALALFDVIEHIEDAPAFLRSLLHACPNVRQVVVTVPAAHELWTSFDGHYGHFRRYDHAGLCGELEGAGLRVDRTAGFFHALYPALRLNITLRGRVRDTRFYAPTQAIPIAIHALLGRCFALEARLLPAKWPSTSILAVAHRP